MTNETRVIANQRVTILIGPDTGLADQTYQTISIAEANALTNVSGAAKADATSFGLQASGTDDDRVWTDQAGAKSRSFTNFSGPIAFLTPTATDTSSIYRVARNLVKTPWTKLVIVVRVGPLNSQPIAAGDVVNIYRVQTDANTHGRDKSKGAIYTISFVPQDTVGVNVIVAPVSAVAVITTPTAAQALTIGSNAKVKAAYQGLNVTVGSAWTSSAPLVASVTPHGIVRGISAGTASITTSVPGSLPSTAIVYTVS